MHTEQLTLRTADGECPAYVMSPEGRGRWPAIIFYGDAGGIRPAMLEMAGGLADAGYVVLLPDLFYRFGSYGPLVPREVFAGDVGAILGPLMATTGVDKASADTDAFLAYLSTRDDILSIKTGAIGFCMGGGFAIGSAATHSERFAAVASFHGGNLATDAPTSPHRLVPGLAAQVYIASADNDETYPPAMAARLEDSLEKAGVQYRAEVYHDALHGWMVPDFPTYDLTAAERGWQAALALFERTLRD
ncbi:dienelactone hydrolase family protein [Paraburkholderia sp. BCC1886]|uniref:dienelactone hydrolase family protein n=1 Tax=Paraburkholderia sp. BCC1886 TaxID=2562670 RepID=UPI001183A363|nr:dienelactone hydrolase family protein [Paraburkholderia sp. BCC1886]